MFAVFETSFGGTFDVRGVRNLLWWQQDNDILEIIQPWQAILIPDP
jgi:hypothetical protein